MNLYVFLIEEIILVDDVGFSEDIFFFLVECNMSILRVESIVSVFCNIIIVFEKVYEYLF